MIKGTPFVLKTKMKAHKVNLLPRLYPKYVFRPNSRPSKHTLTRRIKRDDPIIRIFQSKKVWTVRSGMIHKPRIKF